MQQRVSSHSGPGAPVGRVTCHGSPASPRLGLAEWQPVGPNETGAKDTPLRAKETGGWRGGEGRARRSGQPEEEATKHIHD